MMASLAKLPSAGRVQIPSFATMAVTISAGGDHIDARVEGRMFTASLAMTTHGHRNSFPFGPPGNEFSNAVISLARR
jgi:hypothetical protein